MNQLRQLLMSATYLCLGLSVLSVANAAQQVLDIAIEDQTVLYGEYAEVEVKASEDVLVSFLNNTVPFGMEIEKDSANELVIYGTPLFTGQLCFQVQVQKLATAQTSVEHLCLYSEDNETLEYPLIKSGNLLNTVHVGKYFSKTIQIDSALQTRSSFLGSFPSGVSASVDINGALTISGQVSTVGTFEILLNVESESRETSNYKQFLIHVVAPEIVVETTPIYTCGFGSYYDYYHNRCVRRITIRRGCAIGSRWSSRRGSCVRHHRSRVNRFPRRHRRRGSRTTPRRPNRGGGSTTSPRRPNRGGGSTTSPRRPNRGGGSTTTPSRPNRGGGSTTSPRRPNRGGGSTTSPRRPNRGGGSRTTPRRPNRGGGSTTSPRRPNRGGGSTTTPSRPNRGGGSTTSPRRPNRGGGSTTTPSRLNRGGGSTTSPSRSRGSRGSSGERGNGGRRRRN